MDFDTAFSLTWKFSMVSQLQAFITRQSHLWGGGTKKLENVVIFYFSKLDDGWDVNYKQVAKFNINK